MLDPISRPLNCAIAILSARRFPDGFRAAAHAPTTLGGLVSHLSQASDMVVWNGACDRTIFADPQVNLMFRAWHDWHHADSLNLFTVAGEAATCERQIDEVRAAFGDNAETRHMATLLRIEINGQAEHCAKWGEFPVDQRAFSVAMFAAQTLPEFQF